MADPEADGETSMAVPASRSSFDPPCSPKLTHAVTGAFEVDALFPEADGVCLDYRDFDGTPVRTHFTFTDTGKIRHTACDTIRQAA